MGDIMTCKINADTTDGLKIVSDTSGAVDVQSNGTTRMTVLANGNVGIGASSPETKLDIEGNLLVDAYNAVGAGGGIFLRGGFLNVNQPSITVRTHNADSAPDGLSVNGNDGITFRTASADRGSFAEGGQFLIGTTAFNTGTGHNFHQDGYYYLRRASGAAQTMILFYNNGNAVGEIRTSTTATSYLTSSDYRLKENVSYTFDATARLKQLKPARFNFKTDADTTVDGFLAHEVSSIVPEAISGTKDAVEKWKEGEELPDGISVGDNKLDDGNTIPDYQGIDQSKLVPLLVKTIQELEARITALES